MRESKARKKRLGVGVGGNRWERGEASSAAMSTPSALSYDTCLPRSGPSILDTCIVAYTGGGGGHSTSLSLSTVHKVRTAHSAHIISYCSSYIQRHV